MTLGVTVTHDTVTATSCYVEHCEFDKFSFCFKLKKNELT